MSKAGKTSPLCDSRASSPAARGSPGQLDGEHGALLAVRARRDRATMGGGDLLNDVEPEPQSGGRLASARLSPAEGLEQLREQLGGDGLTLVAYLDAHALALVAEGQRH